MTLSGWRHNVSLFVVKMVLIPLLVDDPLWVKLKTLPLMKLSVLIPLLVDDPLWV